MMLQRMSLPMIQMRSAAMTTLSALSGYEQTNKGHRETDVDDPFPDVAAHLSITHTVDANALPGPCHTRSEIKRIRRFLTYLNRFRLDCW